MPQYDFTCSKCDHKFTEIKGIKAYSDDPISICPQCEHPCGKDERDFSKSRIQFSGTAVVDAQFNPGLGCVVKNKSQKEDICKAKGLVEVGNDFNGGDKMQEHFEKKKKQELDAKWDKDPSDFFL